MKKEVRKGIEQFIKQGYCEMSTPNNFRLVMRELTEMYGIENLNVQYIEDNRLTSVWRIELNSYYKQAN